MVGLLKEENLDFESFDILEDPAVRSELKIFSDWPTYPQLYVNGEFIGGCDIITELYQSGDLADQLK